jgi:iron complex transport system substrate-binding protein
MSVVSRLKFVAPGLWLLLALSSAFLSSACYSSSTNKPPVSNGMREVTDHAGRKIVIPEKLDRVVSLSPNLTEIIFAVGGEDKLVGVTSYCDYPAKAKTISQVGDTIQPDIGRILSLRPQLVLVSTSAQMKVFRRKMEEEKIPFYVTDPQNLDGIFNTILNVGELLDQRAAAEKLVADLRARSQAIEDKVRDKIPVPIFYQVSSEPIFTAGRDSYITDIIRRAGGQNVAANIPEAWPQLTESARLVVQPEAIIMPIRGAATKDKLHVTPILQSSPAVKNERVYGINDYLIERPGPRIIDGLEQMARALQPEAFK